MNLLPSHRILNISEFVTENVWWWRCRRCDIQKHNEIEATSMLVVYLIIDADWDECSIRIYNIQQFMSKMNKDIFRDLWRALYIAKFWNCTLHNCEQFTALAFACFYIGFWLNYAAKRILDLIIILTAIQNLGTG